MNLKNLLKVLFTIGVLTILIGTTTFATTTWYVNNQIGNDGRNGLSPTIPVPDDNVTGPKKTIGGPQGAQASGVNGDIVVVASTGFGYNASSGEPDPIVITKTLTFQSTGGVVNIGSGFQVNTGALASLVTFNSGVFTLSGGLLLTSGTLSNSSQLITVVGGTVEVAALITVTKVSGQLLYSGTVNFQYDANYTTSDEFPNSGTIGNLTTTAGANLTLKTSALTISGNITTAGTLNLGGNTVTLANTGGATVDAFGGNVSAGILAYQLGGGDVTITGAFSIPAITVTTSTSTARTLNITGPTAIAGTVAISGLADLAANGALATIGAGGFSGDELINSGAGIVTIAGAVTVNGNVLLNAATTAATGSQIVFSGATTVNGNVTNISALTVTNAGNWNGATSGQIDFPDAAINITGNVVDNTTIGGVLGTALNVTGFGQITFANTSNNVTINGQINNGSSTSLSGAINPAGFNFNGAITLLSITTGVVRIDGGINSASNFSGITSAANNTTNGLIAIGLNAFRTAGSTVGTNGNPVGAITNSSVGAADGDGNGNIVISGTGASGFFGSSVSVSGSTAGGYIKFGNENFNLSGSINLSRNETGGLTVIQIGNAAVAGATVTIGGSVNNMSNNTIAFNTSSTGAVGITGAITSNTSGGLIVFTNLAAGAFTAGGLTVSNGTVTVPVTSTNTVTFSGAVNVSGGTVNLLGAAGTAINITGNVSFTGGVFTTTGRTAGMTLNGSNITIGGATTNTSLSTAAPIIIGNPTPTSLITVTIGPLNPTLGGDLVINNTTGLATAVSFVGGTLRVPGNLTFTAGAVAMSGQATIVASGNFTNAAGYATADQSRISLIGAGATFGTGAGGGIFGTIEFNNAAGFTASTNVTLTGTVYLTAGPVDNGGKVITVNNSTVLPTVVLNAGSFNQFPTYNSNVNITYIGGDKTTGKELPVATNRLQNLTVSTTNGLQAGQGIVTLTASSTVNGNILINGNQTLLIGNGITLTMKGPSIILNANSLANGVGYISNANLGTGVLALGATAGTTVSGTGYLPDIQVLANSTGNMINANALVTSYLGGDNAWGGAGVNADFVPATGTANGSLTFIAGTNGATVTLSGVTNGTQLGNLTTQGTGNVLTLGGNLIVSGTMVLAPSIINLGTFNLTLNGTGNTIDKGTSFTGTGSLVANPPVAGSTLDGTSGAFTVGNFVVNSSASGTITVCATQNMIVTGTLTVTKGILNITAGQSVTVTGNTITLAVANDVTGTGALVSNPALGTLTINLAGSATISTLTIAGNTTLASSATGTITLTVGTLTHSAGLLTFGNYNIDVTGVGSSFVRTGGTYSAGSGYLQISNPATFTQGTGFVIPNLKITGNVSVVSDQNFTVVNNLYLDGGIFTTTPASTVRLVIGVAGGSVPTVLISDNGNLDAVPTFALGQANYTFPDQSVNIATTSYYWPTGNTTVAQNVTLALSFPAPFKIADGKKNGRKLEFVDGVVNFTDSRTLNGNLTLTEGGIRLNTNVSLTLATSGSTISRTELGDISLNNGTLIAANVNIVYNNSNNNAPAAIGNTGVEFSSPTVVNNLTNNNAGVILNTARSIAGAIVLSGNTEVAQNITAAGSVTINGVTLTIDANTTLTVLGNVTMNGSSTTAGTGSLIFAGATAQSFTVPSAGIQVQNLTVNMTGVKPMLTVSGGSVTINGLLALTNGLVVIGAPNSIVLQSAGGVQGYTKSAVNLSHVVGNVQRNFAQGTLGRYEFPVGTTNVYRLVAMTFNAGLLNGSTITISADSVNPGGANGFPLTINGVTVDTTASFNWKINATPSFGPAQAFDVEFTGTGYTNYSSATIQNIRVVAKLGLVQSNPWVGQGGTYSNFESIPGLPIVRVTNSTGNLITQTAIFTFGFQKPVTTASIVGTVLYGNTPDVGVKNVLVTLNPGAQTVTTAAGGAFQFSNLTSGSYTLSASTANAWLIANATDALLVSNAYNGTVTFSPIQTLAGDVNKSGQDNNTDALLIVRRFAGLDNSFAAGDWVFTTANVTVAGSNVTQNLQGMVTGDVNGSDSAQVSSLPKALATVTSVSGGALKVSPTKEFEVPVKVSSGMSLGAVSLRFSYPNNLVSFEGVSSGNFVTNDVNGKVTIAWADLSGGKQPINLNAGDVLLSLKFKPTANLKMGSQFSLTLDENSSELANEDGRVINNASLNVASVEATVPAAFALKQNYPNPFNPSTTIEYDLPNNGSVKLVVYNILGEQVSTIVNQVQTAGSYRVVWNASSVASGVYFYRITVDANGQQFTQIHRMMLLK